MTTRGPELSGWKSCQNHCVLQHLSSRPPISSRRDESKGHQVLFFFWSKWVRELRPTFMDILLHSARTPSVQALFGDLKNQKPNILRIQIHHAQNVGKVQISREKQFPVRTVLVHFRHFFHGPKTCKTHNMFCYFPCWANGPYSPGLNPCCYPPLVGKCAFDITWAPRIPPPYWPPFRSSDISEYWIFCDIVILDGLTNQIG